MKNKKRFLSNVLFILIIGLCVFLPITFLIVPGFQNISKSKSIIVLSKEDLTKETDNITIKYNSKELNIYNEYSLKEEELKEKYKQKEEEINEKYLLLEKEVNAKYLLEEGEIGWDEEQVNLKKELSELNSTKNDELYKNNQNKYDEEQDLATEKRNDLKKLYREEDNEISFLTSRESDRSRLRALGVTKITWGFVIIFVCFVYNFIIYRLIKRSKRELNNNIEILNNLLTSKKEILIKLLLIDKNNIKKQTLMDLEEIKNITNDSTDQNIKIINKIEKLFDSNKKYIKVKRKATYKKLINDLEEVNSTIKNRTLRYKNSLITYNNYVTYFPTKIIAIAFKL